MVGEMRTFSQSFLASDLAAAQQHVPSGRSGDQVLNPGSPPQVEVRAPRTTDHVALNPSSPSLRALVCLATRRTSQIGAGRLFLESRPSDAAG